MQNETNELRVIPQRVEWKTTREMSGGKLAKTAEPVFYRTPEQKTTHSYLQKQDTGKISTDRGKNHSDGSGILRTRDMTWRSSARVSWCRPQISIDELISGRRAATAFVLFCCVYRVYSFTSSSSLNPPKFSHFSFGSAHGKRSAPH